VIDKDETLNALILSFKSQEDLDTWIASDARNTMLDEASGFHTLSSVQQMDTSAWGMVAGPAKPAPPIWKNTLLVFSALYPTIIFTRIVIEPCLAMLPCWSAFLPEVTSLIMIGITCAIMNMFTMKTASTVIGPRLFPPDTLVRTTLKTVVLLSWAGLLLAVQIPELRGAMVSAVKDAMVIITNS
jgi:antibiotic biosynthesis monooxygenase (ABM) superfamily enzyme